MENAQQCTMMKQKPSHDLSQGVKFSVTNFTLLSQHPFIHSAL